MKKDEFYYIGRLSQIKNEFYIESKKLANKKNNVLLHGKERYDNGFIKLTEKETEQLDYWFLDCKRDDTIAVDALIKIFSDKSANINILNGIDIIFQKVTDNYGNVYAREIKTGLLFPIFNHVKKRGKFLQIRKKHFKSINYIVDFKYKIKYDTIENIESLITSYRVASQNEVDTYKNSFTKSKQVEISNYYIKNTFSKNVVFNNESKVLSEEEIMSYMESIELALFKLEEINSEIAALYKNYYDYICKSKNSNIEIFTEDNLGQLMNGLNLALENVKDNSSLIDYLGNLTSEYMESLDSKMIVNKLDWLMALNDIVLKNNGTISFQEKRRIISRLCLLYILELINNTKDISELKNTYVEVNYKTILLNLMMLTKEDYIECDMDFNKDYTFEETIYLIKSIKFNNLDNNLSLKLFK